MKKSLFAFTSVFLALCSGCSWLGTPEAVEPRTFDLGALNEKEISAPPVEFRSFSDISGNGMRIALRRGDGSVTFEKNSRFSAPPAQLIRRRLTELFPVKSGSAPFIRVSGTVSRFEIDRKNNEALLLIDYELRLGDESKGVRHRITSKVEQGTDAAALALEKCVVGSARRLAGETGVFVKECAKAKVNK